MDVTWTLLHLFELMLIIIKMMKIQSLRKKVTYYIQHGQCPEIYYSLFFKIMMKMKKTDIDMKEWVLKKNAYEYFPKCLICFPEDLGSQDVEFKFSEEGMERNECTRKSSLGYLLNLITYI